MSRYFKPFYAQKGDIVSTQMEMAIMPGKFSSIRGITFKTINGVDYWYARINGHSRYMGKGRAGQKLAEKARGQFILSKNLRKIEKSGFLNPIKSEKSRNAFEMLAITLIGDVWDETIRLECRLADVKAELSEVLDERDKLKEELDRAKIYIEKLKSS